MSNYDLVIRGGTLIDGTGGEPYRADVGVRGGFITWGRNSAAETRRSTPRDCW